MARPTIYTDEIASLICERLMGGDSLRAICAGTNMPAESTVRLWALEDREGFTARYTRARDIGLDSRADEVLAIADGDEDSDPVRDRLRFDARRWYLSKLAPKRYGDKVAHEHTGSEGGPIRVVQELSDDDLAAIAAAGR